MPLHHNDALDDPLLFDGSEGFAGEVSLLKPALLAKEDCASLINVDADRSGRLITRLGTTSYGTPGGANPCRGGFYFKAPTAEYLLTAVDGTVYAYDTSSWTSLTLATGTITGGNQMEFAQLTDKVFFTDGVKVWQWTGTGDATEVASAPASTMLLSHAGRVWYLGQSTTDQVAVSTLLVGDNGFGTATNQFRVGGGEGEGISGAAPWHNFIVAVFKRNAIYLVDAQPTADPVNWQVATVSRNVGCVAHRSIQQVGADMFFLSDDGVRTLARSNNDVQIGVGEPISEPIRPMIQRINWAYAHKACSAFHANRYFLAVPLDSATSNNAVLVYNLTTGKWTGYWSGWTPDFFAVTKFLGRAKLVLGQTDGKVLEWLQWKAASDISSSDYTDDSTAISTTIALREYTFEEPVSPKTGHNYELEFYQSDADVTVQMVLDQGTTEQSYTGKTYSARTTLPAVLPFTLASKGSYRIARDLQSFGQFRGIQPKITASAGKLALQGCKLSAWVDTLEEEKN
jgi:hypothetical protein